jgi:hypothetical protein
MPLILLTDAGNPVKIPVRFLTRDSRGKRRLFSTSLTFFKHLIHLLLTVTDSIMTNDLPTNDPSTSDMQQEIPDTEDGLVSLAQYAVSQCNWTVGNCAAKWTKKYAKGRTDADFAAMIGLSPDQVYQRRRVSETFSDVHTEYPALKWSHFYSAINWDDAADCLGFANDNQETVDGMKRWRRIQHGEEPVEEMPPLDFTGDPMIAFISDQPELVRDPSEFESASVPAETGDLLAERPGDSAQTVSTVARDAEYSPFRSDAGTAPPSSTSGESTTATVAAPQISADQAVKRMITNLERINKTLTPELIAEFGKLPSKLRDRFTRAVAELSSKAAGLL